MSAQVQQAGRPVNLSSSGQLSANACMIIGYHINSTAGGTMVFRSGATSGGTAVTGTITPLVGFTAFPADLPAGGYLTIAGTLDVTVFVQQS